MHYTLVSDFRGGDEKDEMKYKKITNRDVAVIRASVNNNNYYYYHYGPGRRIVIIICESVDVSHIRSRAARAHSHARLYTEKFKNNNNNNNNSRLVGCRY